MPPPPRSPCSSGRPRAAGPPPCQAPGYRYPPRRPAVPLPPGPPQPPEARTGAPLPASAASRGVPALFRQPFRPRTAPGLSGELEVWSVTPLRVSGPGVPCPGSRGTRQQRGGRKLWGVWVCRSAWDTRGVVRASRGSGRGRSLFQGSGRQGQPCQCPGRAAGRASGPPPGDRGPGGAVVAGGPSWPYWGHPGKFTFK